MREYDPGRVIKGFMASLRFLQPPSLGEDVRHAALWIGPPSEELGRCASNLGRVSPWRWTLQPLSSLRCPQPWWRLEDSLVTDADPEPPSSVAPGSLAHEDCGGRSIFVVLASKFWG